MEASQTRLFHFRPLAALAAGISAGVLWGWYAKGTVLFIGLCLFACLILVCVRLKAYAQLIFAGAFMLGAVRTLLFLRFPLPPLTGGLAALLGTVREELLFGCDSLFGEYAALFRAMLWGVRSGAQVTGHFQEAGIAHVLALSGLHVTFLSAAVAKLFPPRHRRAQTVATGLALFLYCAIAAFPASLVRASVMGMCVFGARRYGRPVDTASSMCLAAALILLVAPDQLFEAGFLLSFGAVAGIAMLYDGMRRGLSPLGEAVSASIAVSAGGSLGTLPMVARFFGRLPLYGLLSNILLIPLIPFAFLPGLAACVLHIFSPGAARIPAFAARCVMDVVCGVSDFIAALPYSVLTVPPPSLAACGLYYAALVCLSRYFLVPPRKKWICALLLLVAALCL